MPSAPRSPRGRRRPSSRPVVLLVGAAAVVVGVLGLTARSIGLGWQPAIVLASFAPCTAVVGVVGATVLALRRMWWGVAVGLVVVAATVVVQVPLFVADAPRAGTTVTVLQANLMVGAADPGAVVSRVRDDDVDLLTVDELTPAAVTGLTAAGLDELLPYRLVRASPGGAGTGIWSAHPLTDAVGHDDFSFALLTASVDVPGAVPVHVVAVHLLPPWPYDSATWRSELPRLRSLLGDAADRPGAVVAAGDFNATLDHPQFRSLLRNGFRDAAEQAGAGYRPTYPTDKVLPPLLTLDHVVTRHANAIDARTVGLPGSDHRGLLVALAVPNG